MFELVAKYYTNKIINKHTPVTALQQYYAAKEIVAKCVVNFNLLTGVSMGEWLKVMD